MMWQFCLVALGGATGAVTRYTVALLLRTHWLSSWPVATLLVNGLGSFGIGVVFVLLERGALHSDARSLVVVGFFGAFTTFSTFSLETLHMIERGETGLALSYVSASFLICLLGVAVGVNGARLLS